MNTETPENKIGGMVPAECETGRGGRCKAEIAPVGVIPRANAPAKQAPIAARRGDTVAAGGAVMAAAAVPPGAAVTAPAAGNAAGDDTPLYRPAQLHDMYQHVVDNLFGKEHWMRPWLLTLCTADSAFALHLAAMRRPADKHFLCLLLLRDECAAKWSAEPARMAMRLCTVRKRKILLREFCPGYPRMILKVLPKLADTPMPAAAYSLLCELLHCAFGESVLRQQKRIGFDDLVMADAARNLPPAFQTCEVFRALRHYDEYVDLIHAVALAAKLGLQPSADDVRMIMQEKDEHEGLAGGLAHWQQRQVVGRPFPKPPWPGDENARPLCDLGALQSVAREFDNCAAEETMPYIENVVLGRMYLYLHKRPRALVSLKRCADVGWVIHEMEAPRVREGRRRVRRGPLGREMLRSSGALSVADKHWVIRSFARAGIYPNAGRMWVDEGVV